MQLPDLLEFEFNGHDNHACSGGRMFVEFKSGAYTVGDNKHIQSTLP